MAVRTDPLSVRTLTDLGFVARWSTVRGWSTFDVAFAVVAVGVCAFGIVNDGGTWWQLLPAGLVAPAIAVRSRSPIWSLVGLVAAAVLLLSSPVWSFASILVVIPTATLALQRRYVPAALGALCYVGLLVAKVEPTGVVWAALILGSSQGVWFVVGAAGQAEANERFHEQERRARLAATQAAMAMREAQDTERRAIARELHSIVTDATASIRTQMAAARSDADGEELVAVLGAAEHASRSALADLRRMVVVLRSEDASADAALDRRPRRSLTELPALVEEHAPRAEVRIEVADAGAIAPRAVAVILRVVEDAMALFTTVDGCTLTEVSVDEPVQGSVRVVLRGAAAASDEIQLGYPLLAGLRARVEVVEGHVSVEPDPVTSGLVIEASLQASLVTT